MQASGIVVNISGQPARFEISVIAGSPTVKHKLAPGQSVEIDVGYATRPPSAPGTEPRKSVIEHLTGGQVLPIEDPRARDFLTPEMRQEMADKLTSEVPAPRTKRGKRKKAEEDDIRDLDEVQD